MAVSTTKRKLSATVYYAMTALIFGMIGVVFVQFLIPSWQHGLWTAGPTLAAVHSMILGFMLTMVFGVMYQVIPIAFQAPAIPRNVLFWHLPIHVFCVIGMITGFLLGKLFITGMFGTALLLSTIAFFIIAIKSYRQARNKTSVHQHLRYPFVALGLVMVFGIWMAFYLPGDSFSLYSTHIFLGTFGYWMTLVMVISYKFIPMFTLSHGYKSSMPVAIRIFTIGVALFALATLFHLSFHIAQMAGLIIALIGLVYFTFDMIRIVWARKRKRILYSIRVALVATSVLLVSSVLLFIATAFSISSLILPFAYLLVMDGFALLILAYLQKIVPFLWYEYRYSHHSDRKNAPPIDDMMPKGMTRLGISLYGASTFLGFLELSFHIVVVDTELSVIIQLLLSALAFLGMLLLLFSLLHVLRIGGPRIDQPEES